MYFFEEILKLFIIKLPRATRFIASSNVEATFVISRFIKIECNIITQKINVLLIQYLLITFEINRKETIAQYNRYALIYACKYLFYQRTF